MTREPLSETLRRMGQSAPEFIGEKGSRPGVLTEGIRTVIAFDKNCRRHLNGSPCRFASEPGSVAAAFRVLSERRFERVPIEKRCEHCQREFKKR